VTGPRRGATPEQQVVALGRLLEDTNRQIEALKGELERRFNAQAGDVAEANRGAAQATRAAKKALDLIVELSERLGDDQGGEQEREMPANLLMPDDPEQVLLAMRELKTWLRAVYVRYEGSGDSPAPVLSDCWAWHTAAVVELWTLYRMWLAAYQGPKASDQLVADWHDRYRPGTVRRVNAALTGCRPSKHADRMRYRPPGVHGTEMLPELAGWMVVGQHGQASPPEPTAAMVKEAEARQEQYE
jgi:hypothetical protein